MAVISGLIPLWKLMRNCHIAVSPTSWSNIFFSKQAEEKLVVHKLERDTQRHVLREDIIPRTRFSGTRSPAETLYGFV
jgi:hypothetical protein